MRLGSGEICVINFLKMQQVTASYCLTLGSTQANIPNNELNRIVWQRYCGLIVRVLLFNVPASMVAVGGDVKRMVLSGILMLLQGRILLIQKQFLLPPAWHRQDLVVGLSAV